MNLEKKIIYITAQKVPSIKAHSVQILKMCKYFSILLKTTLICRYQKLNIPFPEKKTFNVKKYSFSENKIILLIQKFLITLKITRTNNTIFYTRDVHFAFFLFILSRKQIFLELHTAYTDKITLSYYLLNIILCKKNVKIIFISRALLTIYKKKFNKKFINYIIAHDASDNYKSKAPSSKKINIGYAGHLYKGRGILLIIKIAKYLKDIQFNIAGGQKKDINYYNKITNNIKNIKFFGYLPHSQVKKFFSRNHILIAPYEKIVTVGNISDTSKFMSPLKIFEYMSSQKPIISSNHKVIREILRNDDNALLCEPNNFNEWVKAIIRLKDKKLRKKLAKKSYSDYLFKHTWEKRVQKIL